MSDNLQEVLFYLLGLAVAVVPLMIDLINNYFQTRTSPKNSKFYLIFFTIMVVALIILGVKKIHRDSSQKIDDDKNTKILKSDLNTLVKQKSKDSIQNLQFLKTLEKTYHIVKDSITNKPKIQIFNTQINKAGTVNIGH